MKAEKWADYNNDTEILVEARRMYEMNLNLDSENREAAKEDMDFIEDPWTPEAKQIRQGRACLNADPLTQFRNKVKNEFAKMEPAIKVRPFDSYADPKMANHIQGLFRHIEDNSRAKRVYDHAQSQMVDTGEGWVRVLYDFCNEESFEEDIFIKRIKNRFAVVPGLYQEFDGSDMETCFVSELISKHDLPESEAYNQSADWPNTEGFNHWIDDDRILVCEYWRVVKKPDVLCLLSNGMRVFQSVIKSGEAKAKLDKLKLRVIKRRDTLRPYVQFFKLTAFDVLEKQEWPGRYIPLIPMIGNELVRADGTTMHYGMVRFSRDQVRMINYMWSEETEMIALQPKTPYVGTQEQFEGKEDQWDAAAEGRSSRVTYNAQVVDGVAIPPPMRQAAPIVPAAMIQSRIGAMELLKGAQGTYNAGLGDQGPQISGRAILAEKANSDNANFHYIDGPEISIQHIARVVIDLARKVITGPTMRRLIGDDGQESMLAFNTPLEGADGKEEIWDLSVGEFDITVEMGPAYATQRQEALKSMTEIAALLPPEQAALLSDIMVGNVDAKDADKAQRRLKAFNQITNPQVMQAAEEDGEGEKDTEQQLQQCQAQLQQEQQKMQQIQVAMEQLNVEFAKVSKIANDKQAQMELEWKKALLDAEVKLATTKSTQKTQLFMKQIETLQKQQPKPAESEE